jgi:K+ transporter
VTIVALKRAKTKTCTKQNLTKDKQRWRCKKKRLHFGFSKRNELPKSVEISRADTHKRHIQEKSILRRRQATCTYKSETFQAQKETLEEKKDAMFPVQNLQQTTDLKTKKLPCAD